MKKITYYCDICGKEIKNPKEELDCVLLNLAYAHSWETSLPLSRNLHDKQICKECGETLNKIINKAKEEGGFKNDN